jgi:hypothetical protein
MGGVCNLTQTAVLAQNAMMYCGLTLLLDAVVLADMASAADLSVSCAGHVRVPDRGGGLGVTWFMCAHCTTTCQLSSCLFLNCAAVRRHISSSKPCFTSSMGFWDIQVEALSSYLMAGCRAEWGRNQTSDTSCQVMYSSSD